MHKFVRNLLTEWRKLDLPFEGETFVVAVSGGADSVSLAVALDDLRKRKKLNSRFVIAHFNHDLRGEESEKDADFVQDLAQKFCFELVYQKGKVSKKGNLEQNARLARYEFLTETAAILPAGGILTAHTINDQAETFLLNLIRGSGITGLAGMKPLITNYKLQITNSEQKSRNSDSEKQSPIASRQSPIALIRPLLNWATREDTENFCRFHNLEFRRDSMNEDLNFRRVRVRQSLLPLLKEFNPKIIQTLAKTANLLGAETETKDQRPETNNQFLILKDLNFLSKPALYKTLREWLEANRGNLRQLDSKHIEAIERLAFSRKSGRIVELPNGESVLKENGKLLWRPKNIENPE
jgi:tRNA(Ile)-lysidine synthase